MKSKVFILEVLTGESVEVFILRDGKGQVVKATPDKSEFLDYLHNSDEIEAEKEAAADQLEEEIKAESPKHHE